MANPSRKISQVRVRTPLDIDHWWKLLRSFNEACITTATRIVSYTYSYGLCHIHPFDKGGHESDSFLSLCEFDSALAAFSFPYLSKCRERSNMQEEGAKWVMHVVGAPYVKSPYEM